MSSTASAPPRPNTLSPAEAEMRRLEAAAAPAAASSAVSPAAVEAGLKQAAAAFNSLAPGLWDEFLDVLAVAGGQEAAAAAGGSAVPASGGHQYRNVAAEFLGSVDSKRLADKQLRGSKQKRAGAFAGAAEVFGAEAAALVAALGAGEAAAGVDLDLGIVLRELRHAKLAAGIMLAGAPLQPPNFHDIAYKTWKLGQQFSLKDDPDRMQQPWEPPAFIAAKDPKVQAAKTTCEELDVNRGRDKHSPPPVDSWARIIRNVLDPEDCAELIRCINTKGFTPALINTGGGGQALYPSARDGHRVMVDNPAFADWLHRVLQPYIPAALADGCVPTEVNERCRFLCYTPGQQFAAHQDGRYTRDKAHPKAGEFSFVTLQLYLHDVPEANGGATTFINREEDIPCQPKAGSVLLFTQNLLHEGSLVSGGLKYTVRSEVMFKKP